MEWSVLFVINWVLFFLLVDWKTLKINIWAGFFTAFIQMFVDSQFISHKLYVIHNPVIDILGSSLFFQAGPVFVIGVMFAQYHPVKKWAVILNVPVVSTIFSIEEYLLVKSNALEYTNWHQIDSIGVNIAAIGLLSWFCIVILGKGKDWGS